MTLHCNLVREKKLKSWLLTNPAGPPLPPSWLSELSEFYTLQNRYYHGEKKKKKKKKIITSFIPLLFTVLKLYYTHYHLRLLMMVCIVLIWFLFTVLQESSNIDAIFIVCRQIKNKISKLLFSLTPPPPPFWSKANLKKKKKNFP